MLMAAACHQHVHVHTHPPAEAGLGLVPGDRVVARWRDAFWSATVLTVEERLVTVAWDVPPPDTSRVSREWMRKLEHPGDDLLAGAWVLCPGSSDAFIPCRVEGVEADEADVRLTDSGSFIRLPRAHLFLVPDELYAWVVDKGDAAIERYLMADRLQSVVPLSAGEPVARPGAEVLARWSDGEWWRGTAIAIDGGEITVAWADGSEPLALAPGDVAPLGNDDGRLEKGSVALCQYGDTTRWSRAHVVALGSKDLEVRYIDGTAVKLATSRCVSGRTD